MPNDHSRPVRRESHVTAEVGSEGGSPGDVELVADEGATSGSEAGETLRPGAQIVIEIDRSEIGEGRRSP